MTDREKVIKGLECCKEAYCPACPYYYETKEGACQMHDDAIALLKEQEVIPHKQYAALDLWWCGCGWCIGKRGTFNYCPNCGKAVKWE